MHRCLPTKNFYYYCRCGGRSRADAERERARRVEAEAGASARVDAVEQVGSHPVPRWMVAWCEGRGNLERGWVGQRWAVKLESERRSLAAERARMLSVSTPCSNRAHALLRSGICTRRQIHTVAALRLIFRGCLGCRRRGGCWPRRSSGTRSSSGSGVMRSRRGTVSPNRDQQRILDPPCNAPRS